MLSPLSSPAWLGGADPGAVTIRWDRRRPLTWLGEPGGQVVRAVKLR